MRGFFFEFRVGRNQMATRVAVTLDRNVAEEDNRRKETGLASSALATQER